MKIIISILVSLGLSLLLAGCSGENGTNGETAEAPDPEATQAMAEAEEKGEAVEQPVAPVYPTPTGLGVPGEGMATKMEAMEKEAESAGKGMAETMDTMKKEAESEGKSMAETDEPEKKDALSTHIASLKQSFDGTKGMDLSGISWDSIPDIPYADKDKLVVWATEQVETWKDKLSDSAMSKGTDVLSQMGMEVDAEASLEKVVSAIEKLQEASPETWESARAALLSQWEAFKKQAGGMME